MSPKPTRQETEAKHKEIAERLQADLVEKMEALTTSDGWLQMLRLASRMPRFSLQNQMLIHLQRPEATYVANFSQWQRLGRHVNEGAGKRGETIWIFKPGRFKPLFKEDDKTGDPELTGYKVLSFDLTAVFDVSSTDGDPLPDVGPKRLTGDGNYDLFVGCVDALQSRGWEIYNEPPTSGEANGEADPSVSRVRLHPRLEPAQTVKTTVHELSHVWLGHTDDLESYRAHRGLKELEAESIAFIVAGAYGVDTSPYSVSYVSHWSTPKDALESAQRVTKAATEILSELGLGRELAQESLAA